MPTISATFRTIEGTQAARGRTGDHEIVVDRPDGVAGGAGLGLNGGQLLALALGGCLANDLRYAAEAAGASLGDVRVDVDLDVEDGRVTGATVSLGATGADLSDVSSVVARAVEISTVLDAVRQGFPVEVTATT
ncbi:OsmC family protein [Aeromicrobium terrae]|jgi:organic hydroperoxide reductase OsmC/OhrA|uniref:OsmC family peroxiredoxin n=1 Tax=Aeromicrobium terrae TaxID=2498846 RepID=A0A5C8NLB3_9ACTN|nr:OsmC family protein [Aeromicrobium terrae]TXL62038.1 OsmC family peroxiredoxin [Aeromicrobium terrae]